jgi:hypothetical protein
MTDDSPDFQMPEAPAEPDPRLRALDKLVGTWRLEHRALDTGEAWFGQDRFAWLDGGFFLSGHHEEFGKNIKGQMLVGYEHRWGEDKPSDALIGHWFESSSGFHFVYIWEVTEDSLTWWFEEQGSEAAFRGTFSPGGNTITGAWRWPGGGYELTMTRVAEDAA